MRYKIYRREKRLQRFTKLVLLFICVLYLTEKIETMILFLLLLFGICQVKMGKFAMHLYNLTEGTKFRDIYDYIQYYSEGVPLHEKLKS